MQNNQKTIISAIVLVGVIIAGAILLKGVKAPMANNPANNTGVPITTLTPVGKDDRTLGSQNAKVTFIMYEDFQCPFCGAVSGLESDSTYIAPLIQSLKRNDPNWAPFMPVVMDYVKNGQVLYVYRDFAFLGSESVRAAEAARCAGDQGKFWEYHDYLYGHQNGENQGYFSDQNLESFAKGLGFNTIAFNLCLSSNKYAQAVADAKTEASTAGVNGTPTGFILRDGKVVATVNGAESATLVKQKIDSALQ